MLGAVILINDFNGSNWIKPYQRPFFVCGAQCLRGTWARDAMQLEVETVPDYTASTCLSLVSMKPSMHSSCGFLSSMCNLGPWVQRDAVWTLNRIEMRRMAVNLTESLPDAQYSCDAIHRYHSRFNPWVLCWKKSCTDEMQTRSNNPDKQGSLTLRISVGTGKPHGGHAKPAYRSYQPVRVEMRSPASEVVAFPVSKYVLCKVNGLCKIAPEKVLLVGDRGRSYKRLVSWSLVPTQQMHSERRPVIDLTVGLQNPQWNQSPIKVHIQLVMQQSTPRHPNSVPDILSFRTISVWVILHV